MRTQQAGLSSRQSFSPTSSVQSPALAARSPLTAPQQESGASGLRSTPGPGREVLPSHRFSEIPIHSGSFAGPAESSLGQSWRAGRQGEAAALVRRRIPGGRPLPNPVRAEMEDHFGRDLSGVRLHTDGRAARAARAVEANAFTVGQHIYFGSQRFRPQTEEGQLRIAHEIVHTLQQTGSARGGEKEEAQAQEAGVLGRDYEGSLDKVAPGIQREPTYPRRATRSQMMRLARLFIHLKRNRKAKNETLRKWSNVGSNFGEITTGSLARRIWTGLFLLHFTPNSRGDVESRHPRYFYSHKYGWIDGQHFFGFIDFAEAQYRSRAGKKNRRQEAFDAATAQGHGIEKKQQAVRDYIILQREGARGKLRHLQVRPPKTPLFRAPVAVAGAVTHQLSRLAAGGLRGTQRELYAQLDERQRNKFFMDSAKSAFTYEDFISNQLGTRFFFKHGMAVNQSPEANRERHFLSALRSFFSSIQVETDPKKVNRLARNLPTIERFEAPKTTEKRDRKKHPELFALP